MKRRLEPVDLAVAVGVFATVLAAQFLWTAADGAIGGPTLAGVGEEQSSGIMSAMQWLQPALGRSIVEENVLRRTAAVGTQTAASQFVQAITAAEGIGRSSSQYLDGIITRAREADRDQAGRIQYVLGRMIVSATVRGVRHDLVSATHPDGTYNHQLVQLAEATAGRMNEDSRNNREQNLGQAIVVASLGHVQSMDSNQERIGTALVRLARVNESFETAKAAEEQRAAVMVAAIRTEALAARMGQLAEIESTGTNQPVPYAAPRALPEIPFSLMAAGSAAAILIFFVGLMVPSKNQGFGSAGSEEEKDSSSYRKTG
ncbi:MAG TPA: hypothetical protein VGJ57_10155 [Nitrospirales bacterium]|jgi:hypothetical protein